MSIMIDLLLIGGLAYAALMGARRGFVLIGLELASFALATGVALVLYHPFSNWIKALAHTSDALSNIFAFTVIWITTELLTAVVVRLKVLPRLHQHLHPSRSSQIGGGALGAAKGLLVITLALIVFVGLPLSSNIRDLATDSIIGRHLLASSGRLQSWLAGGIGRDLSESLNFFTVPAEPESDQRIDLGYTTTAVTVSPANEEAMLVLINQERSSRGLSPLAFNETAREVARTYSRDMFARGFFSHVDLDGRTPFDRMKAGGVTYGAAGENLALAPTLKLAHDGLMNSPGHRANILKPEYRTVGIGIIDGGPYGLMVTQNFTD